MRLILVRHGRTDWNREYRVQGHSDIPLNKTGRMQAEAIAKVLKDEQIEAIYSSPLSRAYATAQEISKYHDVEVESDIRLKELDVGEVDGFNYPSLKTELPDFYNEWMSNPAFATWPGGESLTDLQLRMWDFAQEIISENNSHSLLIASHLFSILVLLCKLLGIDLCNFRRLNLSVASISNIEMNNEIVRLITFNDTCHLRNL